MCFLCVLIISHLMWEKFVVSCQWDALDPLNSYTIWHAWKLGTEKNSINFFSKQISCLIWTFSTWKNEGITKWCANFSKLICILNWTTIRSKHLWSRIQMHFKRYFRHLPTMHQKLELYLFSGDFIFNCSENSSWITIQAQLQNFYGPIVRMCLLRVY